MLFVATSPPFLVRAVMLKVPPPFMGDTSRLICEDRLCSLGTHLVGAGGGPTFNEMTYGRNCILETHFFEAQHFMFKNLASPKIMEAKVHFTQVILNLPPAFLACVQC
jgi:hypothetical protein